MKTRSKNPKREVIKEFKNTINKIMQTNKDATKITFDYLTFKDQMNLLKTNSKIKERIVTDNTYKILNFLSNNNLVFNDNYNIIDVVKTGYTKATKKDIKQAIQIYFNDFSSKLKDNSNFKGDPKNGKELYKLYTQEDTIILSNENFKDYSEYYLSNIGYSFDKNFDFNQINKTNEEFLESIAYIYIDNTNIDKVLKHLIDNDLKVKINFNNNNNVVNFDTEHIYIERLLEYSEQYNNYIIKLGFNSFKPPEDLIKILELNITSLKSIKIFESMYLAIEDDEDDKNIFNRFIKAIENLEKLTDLYIYDLPCLYSILENKQLCKLIKDLVLDEEPQELGGWSTEEFFKVKEVYEEHRKVINFKLLSKSMIENLYITHYILSTKDMKKLLNDIKSLKHITISLIDDYTGVNFFNPILKNITDFNQKIESIEIRRISNDYSTEDLIIDSCIKIRHGNAEIETIEDMINNIIVKISKYESDLLKIDIDNEENYVKILSSKMVNKNKIKELRKVAYDIIELYTEYSFSELKFINFYEIAASKINFPKQCDKLRIIEFKNVDFNEEFENHKVYNQITRIDVENENCSNFMKWIIDNASNFRKLEFINFRCCMEDKNTNLFKEQIFKSLTNLKYVVFNKI